MHLCLSQWLPGTRTPSLEALAAHLSSCSPSRHVAGSWGDSAPNSLPSLFHWDAVQACCQFCLTTAAIHSPNTCPTARVGARLRHRGIGAFPARGFRDAQGVGVEGSGWRSWQQEGQHSPEADTWELATALHGTEPGDSLVQSWQLQGESWALPATRETPGKVEAAACGPG